MVMKKAVLVMGVVCSLAIAAGAAAQTAAAQAVSSQMASSRTAVHGGVAIKFGVLGAGVDVAVPVGRRVNVRAGVSGFSLSHVFENDGITLDANLKLRSASASLDVFPFGGGFHVSPGVMLYNGNEATAVASVPAGRTFTLGSQDFVSDPANPVTGTATITFERRLAPSLMLGWGNIVPRSGRHWSVPFELGVVYTKAPTAVLGLSGNACDTRGLTCRAITTDAGLQAEVRAQEAKINDTIDVLKVLPVFSIGLAFSF